MTLPDQSEQIDDSPTGWVAKHVRRYLETDGAEGAKHRGMDALLIVTRGRRSGRLRRTALFYGRDEDRYVVVGSDGGAKEHPNWYLNLIADPDIHVQVGAEKFAARARPATVEERPRLWELMTGIFPMYAAYQRKTTREIPLVVIDPL